MNFEYSDRVKAMKPSIIREILKQMSDPELISFAGGNPDAAAFPAAEIRQISDQLLDKEAVGTLQYSVTEGYTPLRTAGEAYLNQRWPVKKPEDMLIVTSGSQQVMDYLAKLLCNEGDVVATENPAFLGALGAFRAYGVRLQGVPMQRDGVDLAALEAVFAAKPRPRFFYTIPNFQNPTGITTSLEKRRAIYELAVRYNVPVLEDNPYGELRIAGEDLPPIKSFDEVGAVIYAASLSKIFAPGMRVAFCVGQQDLVQKMVAAKQANDVHTNIWAQRVCERFLATCDMQAHIQRLREIYRLKAQRMMECIDAKLGERVHYEPVDGGMFIWMQLPEAVPMQEFVRRCLQRKLAVVPGNAFFVEEEAPCCAVRLNFSSPSFEQIEKGTDILAAVLDEMLAGGQQ